MRFIGCLAVFGLPFLFVGLGLVAVGVFMTRGNEPMGVQFLTMGLAFTTAGTGVIATGITGLVASHRKKHRIASFPREPWKHVTTFEGLRVQGSGAGTVVALWGGLVGVAAFLSPFVVVFPEMSQESWIPYVVLSAFGIAWIGLLFVAVRTTLRFARHGRPELLLDVVPSAPGSTLHGVVVTRNLPQNVPAELTLLVATTSTHRSRGEVRTLTTNAHRAQLTVEAGAIRRRGELAGIPVRLELPELPPNGDESDVLSWRWSLAVRAGPVSETFALPIWKPEGAPVERRMEPHPV